MKQPVQRRLAAILAADVAGYSRLMGLDEEGTHKRLKTHLSELVEPKISEHRGRTVKNTGDGFLVEFPTVVDAVRCAAEVQRGMIDREPEVPDEQRIRFRIGSAQVAMWLLFLAIIHFALLIVFATLIPPRVLLFDVQKGGVLAGSRRLGSPRPAFGLATESRREPLSNPSHLSRLIW
jgi:hypothetical protein